MAPDYQIYLRDELVEPHNTSRKRTVAEIHDIFPLVGLQPHLP